MRTIGQALYRQANSGVCSFFALTVQSLMDDSLYVRLDAAKAAALIVDENDPEAVCWIRGRVKDAKKQVRDAELACCPRA